MFYLCYQYLNCITVRISVWLFANHGFTESIHHSTFKHIFKLCFLKDILRNLMPTKICIKWIITFCWKACHQPSTIYTKAYKTAKGNILLRFIIYGATFKVTACISVVLLHLNYQNIVKFLFFIRRPDFKRVC